MANELETLKTERRISLTENERRDLHHSLADTMNRHGMDSIAETPDHVLAEHLVSCLELYIVTNANRDKWNALD